MVFLWWSTKSRALLPASLYISFEQCNMLSMEPALRSMLPFQEETGKPTRGEGSGICNESTHLNLDDTLSILENKKADVKWLRKEGEPFEIPEQLSLSLESTVSCQNLKFSSLGRLNNEDSYLQVDRQSHFAGRKHVKSLRFRGGLCGQKDVFQVCPRNALLGQDGRTR
ncbi:UNVERIFIED_CONTAM: Ahi1 [Trichonephila clavipes]